ncbi:hypothetical protein ANOM_004596 [Aspergillus nomiae NRRL 13137]|uniref:Apple domain-containing protein n=1 Tax=Aspergillus nomiae NRRL (strain ATCC 15546 / NRRL 13137 / CBS 260.88 / M93) TaxID=1509407 RepID=A0A0L1J937_ASPN3|nr:uncharacterized protein ANOM_004596 [Aspergillus nomiae NRRL 13137]KNG88210.1 hypothetical protein ANOM_004596 [Aspergillus nomiae NRRL 13137]
MHLQALVPLIPLFASLTVGQSSSTARALYYKVCPEHDGQEKAINSNVLVTYHCDQRPTSRDRTVISAGSPDECATICSKSASCEASLWAGKETTAGRQANTAKSCVLYHSLGGSLIPESHVVYMTYRAKEDPLFPDEDDECKDDKARIGHLQVQVDDLKRQLETCNGKCEKGCFECPEYDQDHIYDRGNDYKVYCGLLDDAGWTSDDLATFGDKTPKECVQACTDTPKCKRAIWVTAQPSNKKGSCWLRDYTVRAGPVPTKKTGYSSAHLQ